VPLKEARKNFERLGASEPAFLEIVRAPGKGEARGPWSTRDALIALRADVVRAFDDVRRCNGTSLQEAEWNDDYCYGKPSREVDAADPEVHWLEVTDAKLEGYSWGNFCFMDVWGLRFYTPRYLVRYTDVLLENQKPIDALDSLLWSLAREAEPLVRLLTLEQYEAVQQCMRAIEWWNEYAAADALGVLEKWAPLRPVAGADVSTAQPPPRRE